MIPLLNPVVTVLNTPINGLRAVCTLLITGRNAFKMSRRLSNATAATSAPIRPKADFTLASAPVNSLLASLACAPKASSIASENILKLILPSLTISRTSASLLFKALARVAAALTPLLDSCKRSLPISRPLPATPTKIRPISEYSLPVIAATPETALKDEYIASPALMPDAPS